MKLFWLLLLLAAVGSWAKLEKVSLEEAAKLSKNFKHFAASEVDSDQARKAIAQLQEQEAKIKQSTEEARVREAQAKWAKLTPQQQAAVVQLAQKQAEERRLALEASLRVLEKQQVEHELREELDQKAELDRQEMLAEQAAEDKKVLLEFDANREAFRAEQALKRTTAKSLGFWAGVFACGVVATRAAAAFAS